MGGPTIFTVPSPASFASQLIPASQDVVLEIQSHNESTVPYTVTVTTTAAAPEPGTIALAGLAPLLRRSRSGTETPQAIDELPGFPPSRRERYLRRWLRWFLLKPLSMAGSRRTVWQRTLRTTSRFHAPDQTW